MPCRPSTRVSPHLSRHFIESALFEAVRRHGRSGHRCLNLGAGPHGRYADLFADMTVDAVDIADPVGVQPWRYHRADAARLPFPDAVFDLVVSVEAFEHIEKNDAAIAEVARVMTPGAMFIMTTPTFWTWPFELGTHGPHYYSRLRLERLVAGTALEVEEVRSLGGIVTWSVGLAKSWISLPGFKLFGDRWWPFIDAALTPAYWMAARVDDRLRVLPSNYVLIAQKPAVK